jgi:hypothetical protein
MMVDRTQVRKRLQNLKVKEVTQKQINDAAGVTFLSDPQALTDAVTLATTVHRVRTFGAWPDPGAGVNLETSGTSGSLTPSSGEMYEIMGISATNAGGSESIVTVSLHDGSSQTIISQQAVAGGGAVGVVALNFPILLTNTLYLNLTATQAVTFNVAYHVAVRGA